MVLAAARCLGYEQLEAVYRHGKTRDGRQRYRCTGCCRTFQLQYQPKAYEPGTRARITDLALNGSGVRDTVRVLGSSPQTVMGELKKNDAVNQVENAANGRRWLSYSAAAPTPHFGACWPC